MTVPPREERSRASSTIGPLPSSSATMLHRAAPAGLMRFGYPLMLDLTDRPVVIVGGGEVAVRKVRGLLDAGAPRITVVATDFHADLPPTVVRVAERYEARHLDGAELVFAATDGREVNDAVVRDC